MNSNENEDISYELGRAQQSHIGHVGYWSPGLSLVSRSVQKQMSSSDEPFEHGRLSSLWARIRGEAEVGQADAGAGGGGGGGGALDLTDDTSNLEYLLSAQNGLW